MVGCILLGLTFLQGAINSINRSRVAGLKALLHKQYIQNMPEWQIGTFGHN